MGEALPSHAIAIIGMAGRFPGARNLDEFWQNIREGVENLVSFDDCDLDQAGVSESERKHPLYVRKGTVLGETDLFDAGFFGFSNREAQILDPQHRLFLECAWEGLEQAGYAVGALEQTVGVYAGASMNSYLGAHLMRDQDLVGAVGNYQVMLGNDKDFLCTRVSYKLDLRGPSVTIQTACSTSLVAVQVACQALLRGDCDIALAGGVSISFPERAGYRYQEGMILSPDGRCRPFDAKAKGTRGGAGAGVVVLKRFAQALADRDTIHAVIRGFAMNNDGASKAGYTAPSVDGQIEVVAMAQAMAQVDPRTISYLETHGTGTPLGDPIEIAALTRVFRASTDDVGFCRLGSLKANIGHLDVAAGVAGLIKTVLALGHREIPPLVNFQEPNPQLALGTSPFHASAEGSAWIANGSSRRAGVSSFGIGGTNAHVVVEEAPLIFEKPSSRSAHLIVLSAKTEKALDKATENLATSLQIRRDLSMTDVEGTLMVGRKAFAHRRALVARDAIQAVELLRKSRQAPYLTAHHEGGARPVVFMFTGQGSQYAGMGAAIYETEKVYRDAVDRCAEILQRHLNLDIREVLYGHRDDARINETRLAQPALFTTEYALASLWMSFGVTPVAMLGHSIGEYTAACLAGVMSLEDVLAVVSERGRLMQALPSGAMASVYLSAHETVELLTDGVEIAAVNAPDLCTVSGPAASVQQLLQRLEESEIKSRLLHVSHAFHSAMMKQALAPFTTFLEKISLSPPRLPYISNVTGTWITPEQATSPAYYATQLRSPVQFEAGVRTIAADSAPYFLEVGPGDTLTSLARTTLGSDKKRVIASLRRAESTRSEIETLLDAAGRLWVAGTTIDWTKLHALDFRRIPLPTYPFERQKHWVNAPSSTERENSTASPRRNSDSIDWIYAPTWMRDDSLCGIKTHGAGIWLVLGQLSPLTDAVIDGLRSTGAVVVRVEAAQQFRRRNTLFYEVRVGNSADISVMAAELKAAGMFVSGAIYLWSIPEAGKGIAGLEGAYHGVVALATGLDAVSLANQTTILAVTVGAVSVLDERVHNKTAALTLGPVLVLPTELPGLRCKSIDIAVGEEPAAAARELLKEVVALDDEKVIARRAGRRWVRRLTPVRLPAENTSGPMLRHRGAYLITGGLGGMGLTLGRWLATTSSARLLLTSRTSLPPHEARAAWLDDHPIDDNISATIRAIREIEQLGGEVLVVAADATDASAMAHAVATAREKWKGLDGVIHAAGVPGNGRIASLKSYDDVDAVLAPKVDGLDILVQLLGEDRLDFVALMSSVNALAGAPGVCDYSAANAVLDAFVDSAARPAAWQHVCSINWAAWRDVGMAARLKVSRSRQAQWDAYLDAAIPPNAAGDIFARVLASGRRRVVISPYDITKQAFAESQDARKTASVSEVAHLSPSVDDAAVLSAFPNQPETQTERRLMVIWHELLGVEAIGLDDDFFAVGGHSLVATRLLARIFDLFGIRLALDDIFAAPTVRQLADRITGQDRSVGSVRVLSDGREEFEI